MSLPIKHYAITPLITDTHTNTTTEAAFTRYVTIPANTLRVGDRIEAFATVKATSTNGADTLRIYLMLGIASTVTKDSTTGVVLATNTALDVANNDVIGAFAVGQVLELGAASTARIASLGFGALTHLAAATSGVLATYLATNVDLAVYVVADWSAASASNICHLSALDVVIHPAIPVESP